MYTYAAQQPPLQQLARQLLIDGCIANMFGPRDAEAYQSTLLRRGAGPLQEYSAPGYPRTFFAVPSPGPGVDPQTAWIVDYVIGDMGTVIPQRLWSPRLRHEFLRPPIFFFRNGGIGLPLNQAAGGNCMYLHGASHTAPLGETCGTHAQIRINWHGYPQWDRQIMTRTQDRAGPEIIPLERFVKHIARKVLNFMTEAINQPYSSTDPRWFIGNGGITIDDVVLIGAVHVSQGSWMPILQMNRFVM